MILQVSKINKSFGTDEILRDISFHIEDNEKAALIGINGAGKSTLFKIIVGEMSPDCGDIIISKDKKIGYLAQHQDFSSSNTIYDEILTMKKDILDLEQKMRRLEERMQHASADELEMLMKEYTDTNHFYELNNGYAYKSEVVGVLKGLGFTEADFDKQVATLSGGQKTRVSLAKLLLSKPDIILLDEPTNHLDLPSINWLENYLLNYSGAVFIIAHDRYFINKIVTKVIEIEHSCARVYTGNYDDYSEKKAQIRKAELNAYYKQQEEIKHQEEVIAKLKSFNREKSIKRAESREKMLDKIDLLEKPAGENKQINFTLTPAITSGNDVLTIKNLSKSFGSNLLFKDFSYLIKRGQKIAIIGSNGTGKTTLLKILRGITTADSGSFTFGAKVYTGYYDQEQNILDPDKNIFDEIHDAYPDMDNTAIRNTLAAFLFTGDDVFKLIKELSGGEKGRVSLAKLMLSNSNFLMLDEPTNHLDINSKEILEEAINSYEGTVLYVSHDRYFINKTATAILDLTRGRFISYDGDYDYYLAKKDIVEATTFGSGTTEIEVKKLTANKLDWVKQKETESAKRKLASDIKKCENEIEKIENRIKEINEELNNPAIASNAYELTKLTNEQDTLNERMLELMDTWEELQTMTE
ncbi:MAG: ribosomal protection-like ABC-F family protein [Lachnospiraceae bacterium]